MFFFRRLREQREKERRLKWELESMRKETGEFNKWRTTDYCNEKKVDAPRGASTKLGKTDTITH